MPPVYPFPKKTLLALLTAATLRRKLSFQKIARYCTGLLKPPPKVYGSENIPMEGGYVLVINHFTRPGFMAWWLALASSANIPQEVHWVQSNAWRMSGWQRPLSGLTRWLFPRVAEGLSFTPMPPIPPDPEQVEQRAQAVRNVLTSVRLNPQIIIGLAPEGSDEEDGCLKMPPPGTGRFIELLAHLGLGFLPVGYFEEQDVPCLRFGPLFQLNSPAKEASADERDRLISKIVMSSIAALLPTGLWGEFDPSIETKSLRRDA